MSCTRSHKATSWPKGEKGIRCESGTIPVAVYLNSAFRVWFIAIFATGNNWEGAINGMSQKTYLGALGKIIPAGYGYESKTVFFHSIHKLGIK